MSVCLSAMHSLSVCRSCMHFHLWETLKKLPIAYRLSPQRIPSERNVLMSSFSCLTIIRFCLSVFYEFLFVRDFEKAAYRLSPITSTYTKWEECLHFLFDYNQILSVCLQCLSVCLSDWYAFSFLRGFEKVAYSLSPIPQHIQSEWNILIQILAQTAVLVHAYTSACINHSC